MKIRMYASGIMLFLAIITGRIARARALTHLSPLTTWREKLVNNLACPSSRNFICLSVPNFQVFEGLHKLLVKGEWWAGVLSLKEHNLKVEWVGRNWSSKGKHSAHQKNVK